MAARLVPRAQNTGSNPPTNPDVAPIGRSDHTQEDHETEGNGLEEQQEAQRSGGGGQGEGPGPPSESQPAADGAGGGAEGHEKGEPSILPPSSYLSFSLFFSFGRATQLARS